MRAQTLRLNEPPAPAAETGPCGRTCAAAGRKAGWSSAQRILAEVREPSIPGRFLSLNRFPSFMAVLVLVSVLNDAEELRPVLLFEVWAKALDDLS